MKLQTLKKIVIKPGEEKELARMLMQARAPIILSMPEFPKTFDIKYFKPLKPNAISNYMVCQNGSYHSPALNQYSKVLSDIDENKPFRVFGEFFNEVVNTKIEALVPLWQHLTITPRGFRHSTRLPFFFGGKGAVTTLHYDREYGCNMHLCLSGEKKFFLFTESEDDYLYKEPFIGDTIMPFTKDYEKVSEIYVKLKNAQCYMADLTCGDMLFMPKNCWHYVEYQSPSAAVCFTFYQKVSLQFLGAIKGICYAGYIHVFEIRQRPFIRKCCDRYALATGKKKWFLKLAAKIIYAVCALPLFIATIVTMKRRPQKLY